MSCMKNNDNYKKQWPHVLQTTKVHNNNQIESHDHNEQNNHDNDHDQKKEQQHNNNSINNISIISFNILAESYLSQRSHPNLPERYKNIIFDTNKRRELLKETLTKLSFAFYSTTNNKSITDIICLQEVDMYNDMIKDYMHGLNYDSFRTNSGNRVDSCCIFWNKDKYALCDYKLINFDDLATLSSSPSIASDNNTINKDIDETKERKSPTKTKKRPSELTGLVQSFIRKNTAIIIALEHKPSKEKIIISNSHLYWNPNYEYVKLSQCKYLLDECYKFSLQHSGTDDRESQKIPIIICGDFNSKPDSYVYRYVMDGIIDARRVAPWYYWPDASNNKDLDNFSVSSNGNNKDITISKISNDMKQNIENNNHKEILSMNKLSIHDDNNNNNHYSPLKLLSSSSNKNNIHYDDCENKKDNANNNDKIIISTPSKSSTTTTTTVPKVRYVVDFSLNKFSRWLRMFGIDTELETDLEERERTSGVRIALFERAYKEKRCLITTSYKLVLRKGCPPGTYLINPSKNLKETFCHLLLTHGITLQPSIFLTRCVVCNHIITQVYDELIKIDIFHKNGLYEVIPNLDVYQCTGCLRGYWWSDRPNSSASRIKNAVSYLFQLALEYGIPYDTNDVSDDDLSIFLNIDHQEQQLEDGIPKEKKKISNDNNIRKYALPKVLNWLHDKELKHSIPSLTSAYYNSQTNNEELSFTNVTDGFIGALDYIFYESNHWNCEYRLDVPMTLKEMNYDNLDDCNAHCIPSDLWPSDHLAIGCLLTRKKLEAVTGVCVLMNNDEHVKHVSHLGKAHN